MLFSFDALAGVQKDGTPIPGNPINRRLFGLKLEVEPRACLEHHAPPHAVAPATNDSKRCHERQNFVLFLKLGRAPHFAMLGFQILSTPFNGVDFDGHLTAD